MANLHETQMGQKFFSRDVPALIKGINRLADALEKQEVKTEKKREVKDERVEKEVDTALRMLYFKDKRREYSEDVLSDIMSTDVIMDRCINDEQVVTEDIVITALMEIVYKSHQ